MKKCFVLCFCLLGIYKPAWNQSPSLFDDTAIPKIFLDLPADSLQQMIQNIEHEYYYHTRFIFDDGQHRDTLLDAGLHLRGNTSLSAKKKSFKISFNEYVANREYQGVRKLNLRGSHNDPSMVREKLFYETWGKAGMPERRANFVQLYINGEYRGLYTNIEEIDKQWLTRVFDNNDGNLYKCTWPANLAYLGDNPDAYKNIFNSPDTRAYDLATNESADDYTRLVDLIRMLNQPVDVNFAANINQILDVQSVLKAFALDVASGNWDDYFYNQNNYYLYDNPVTGKFEFITFDTDNTFGVDWVGQNWAKRNCLQWLPAQQNRPLGVNLLAVPAFYSDYTHYLDTITRLIVHPDSIFPRIDYLHQQITPAAEADHYRTLDYGYDINDFHNSFSQTIDGHTPYGIKPFLQIRHDSTLRQIAHLISATNDPIPAGLDVSLHPNPAHQWITLEFATMPESSPLQITVYDMLGIQLKTAIWQHPAIAFTLDLASTPPGLYWLQLNSGKAHQNWIFQKI